MEVLVAQSCPTLCNAMDCSPPGSSVHGISQVRILEWVAIPRWLKSSLTFAPGAAVLGGAPPGVGVLGGAPPGAVVLGGAPPGAALLGGAPENLWVLSVQQ